MVFLCFPRSCCLPIHKDVIGYTYYPIQAFQCRCQPHVKLVWCTGITKWQTKPSPFAVWCMHGCHLWGLLIKGDLEEPSLTSTREKHFAELSLWSCSLRVGIWRFGRWMALFTVRLTNKTAWACGDVPSNPCPKGKSPKSKTPLRGMLQHC